MSAPVLSHQVPLSLSVNATPISHPFREHTITDSAQLKADQSLTNEITAQISTPQTTSTRIKTSAIAGKKRKSEKLMQFPHDELERNLTNAELITITNKTNTLPTLPETKHTFSNPNKIPSSPERSIFKKPCLGRPTTHIYPQLIQPTYFQPCQSNILQPSIAASTQFRFLSTPVPIISSSILGKQMHTTPKVWRVPPRNSFTVTPSNTTPVGMNVKSITNISTKNGGRNLHSKPQMRYDPEVPMSKQEAAIWRREKRRVRNRESAALSRQKTRDRIVELETELNGWQTKYMEAMARVQMLEGQQQIQEGTTGGTASTPITSPSNYKSRCSMISPTCSRSASPVTFNDTAPQIVSSLPRLSIDSAVLTSSLPLDSVSYIAQDSQPSYQPLTHPCRGQLHHQQATNSTVFTRSPQLVPTSNLNPNQFLNDAETKITSLVVPDSCSSICAVKSGAISSGATSTGTLIPVSESSDDDTIVGSISPDVDQGGIPYTNAPTGANDISVLNDDANFLDDILLDALNEIDGFCEKSSYAL